MALKTKVREYREKAGLKQSELAEMVHVRRETIVHLENNRYNPSLKLAMDIAKIFQAAVEDIFEFTEDEERCPAHESRTRDWVRKDTMPVCGNIGEN